MTPVYQVCLDGKGTNISGNLLACDCQGDFELDEGTKLCKLKPICGEGGKGKIDCDEQNALCIIDGDELGGYDCECPTGTQHKSKTNLTCIDVCQAEDRNKTCEDRYARCNPLLIVPDEPKLLPRDFCECGPGHIWHEIEEKCMIASHAESFEISIKINLEHKDNLENGHNTTDKLNEKYYYDLETLSKDIEHARESNRKRLEQAETKLKQERIIDYVKEHMKNILKITGYLKDGQENRFLVKDCQLNKEYYDCQLNLFFTEEDDNEDSDIGSLMESICVVNTEVRGECFFLNYDQSNTRRYKRDVTRNSGSVFSLTANQEKLKQAKLVIYNVSYMLIRVEE